jgi:paraquat-inducible protein B
VTSEYPSAQVEKAPSFSLIWIAPVLATVLAVVLCWQAWGERGLPVTILFEHGHGLRPGDTLRHLGIVVGSVDQVSLAPGRDGVEVRAVLEPDAKHLATVGSRFWIVRPELGVSAIAGLDTLIGNRYIAVLPGTSPSQSRFIGLVRAPLGDALQTGLDIALEGPTRGSLVAGSPLTYRRIRVGSVLSVDLASDGRTVEVAARIRQEYASLIRADTRFWDAGGLTLDVGLSGVKVHLDTLETLIRGGISLAVPEGAGEAFLPGRPFTLHREPKSDWLDWQPAVALGHTLLPPGTPLPRPARGTLTWTSGRFWSTDQSREGWVLGLSGSILAPIDLLSPDVGADDGSAALQVSGEAHALGGPSSLPTPGLGLLVLESPSGLPAWPRERQRVARAPEDCLLVGDPEEQPYSLAAARFAPELGRWVVDEALPLGTRWHGAAVLARSDGRLIGILSVEGKVATVVLLPHPLP